MDLVLHNISEVLTGSGFLKKDGRKVNESDLAILKNAALVVHNGKFVFVGPKAKLNSFINSYKKQNPKKIKFKEIDVKKQNVFPGFVEAHTHLVFAGDRRDEFELRNKGLSYQEISAQGGGIKKTVSATRAISQKQLETISQMRVNEFVRQGVTTIESKSGYGLNVETESKILKINRSLKNARIVSTFLGLHSLPPESQSKAEYVKSMISLLPNIHKKKLLDRVDLFIEKNFFDLEDARHLFYEAKKLGLGITAHTEQMSHTGGVNEVLLADGQSGDHLVEITDDEIKKLSKSNTVAMLLPTSDFYLKIKYPPARKLIDSGAAVALATDYNPGTSPTQDLSLVGVLARLEMNMSLPEVFCAYTYNASKALGLSKSVGVIHSGYSADFFMSDGNYDDFFYQVGSHPVSFSASPFHKI